MCSSPCHEPRAAGPGSSHALGDGVGLRYHLGLLRTGIARPHDLVRQSTATSGAQRPSDRQMPSLIRRLLIGKPIPTDRQEHERVGRLGGLAVFASDALSSVAYGPEEILLMLVLAGSAGLSYTIPVGIAVAVLITIVATSYRQTIMEYPSGGGAYVVARENLGVFASHVAGAALLTDYVLTVAVSVAAGTAAITSAWSGLHEERVAIAVLCVLGIMLANLRGLRESAALFALPTYGFIFILAALILTGLARLATGSLQPAEPTHFPSTLQPLTLFLILRSFSSGCASLTGIEAVANGVQAFREPRGRNAAAVMVYIAAILASTVLGVCFLAHTLGVTPLTQDVVAQARAAGDVSVTEETVLSQLGRIVLGHGTLYYLLQTLTALILILAANTSFAGFPRLAAFMARDGYLPRQMMNLGDRLVYSNGIIVLAGLACVLIVGFRGDVTRLIPLYAVGVFTAFTLSQAGMVRHLARSGAPGWRLRAAVNGFGACCTAVVLVVVAVTKFKTGAWIVCIVIPTLVLSFRAISRHYRYVASRLTLDMAHIVHPLKNLNLLLVGGIHRGTLEALQYMKAQATTGRAVHVEIGGEREPRVLREWQRWEQSIPLVVLPCPERDLAATLIEYVDKVRQEEGYDIVTLILPEFVVDSWWESLLHNHTVLWLQWALRGRTDMALLNMRYRL